MGVILYPVAYTDNYTIDGSVAVVTLPKMETCDETSTKGLINLGTDVWNCRKDYVGADHRFNMAIPDDETIDFQFSILDLFSADKENPDLGWDDWIFVTVYDFQNSLLETALENIAIRYNNIWTGEKNVQTIRIDTSLFDGDCYRFKFTTSMGHEYWSQDFYRAYECRNWLEVEGIYTNKDCENVYYGTGVGVGDTALTYSNRIWIPAMLTQPRNSFNKEDFNESRYGSIETTTIYELTLNKPIPPYLNNIIWGIILAAREVYINGDVYQLDSSDLRRTNLSGRMFHWSAVELSTSCKTEC